MARYEYNGEQELVFPTLGVVVKQGDVFDAPAGLTIEGVIIVSKGKKTVEDLYDAENVAEVEALDSVEAESESADDSSK